MDGPFIYCSQYQVNRLLVCLRVAWIVLAAQCAVPHFGAVPLAPIVLGQLVFNCCYHMWMDPSI